MTLREIAGKIDASSELLATLSHYFVGARQERLAMACEQAFCEIQAQVSELRRRDEAGPDVRISSEFVHVLDEEPVRLDGEAPVEVGLFEVEA